MTNEETVLNDPQNLTITQDQFSTSFFIPSDGTEVLIEKKLLNSTNIIEINIWDGTNTTRDVSLRDMLLGSWFTSAPTFQPTGAPFTRAPTRVPTLRPTYESLEISAANFSQDDTSLLIEFNQATNMVYGDSFDCGKILVDSTVELLGASYNESSMGVSSAYCSWINPTTLSVVLGYGATLEPGDSVIFKEIENCDEGAICSEVSGHESATTADILPAIVTPEGTPVFIEAKAIYPWAFGICNDLTLSSVSYGGAGRDLVFNWTLPMEFGNVSECLSIPTTLETVFIPEECILAVVLNRTCGFNSTDGNSTCFETPMPKNFSVGLTVTNWLDQWHSSVFEVYYTASVIPEVSFRGSISETINREETFEFPVDVTVPEGCESMAGDVSGWFSYQWSQDSGGNNPEIFGWDADVLINDVGIELTSSQASNKNLVLEAFTLEYGKYYVFKLEVIIGDLKNGYNYLGVYCNERFNPVPSDFEVKFSPYSANSLSVLDAFIFSEPRGIGAPAWFKDGRELANVTSQVEAIRLLYSFYWSCMDPEGVECDVKDDEFGNLVYSIKESEQTFSVIGIYSFNVTIANAQSQSLGTYFIPIEVSEELFPTVFLDPGRIVVSYGEQANLQVYVIPSWAEHDMMASTKEASLAPNELVNLYSLQWSASAGPDAKPLTDPAFTGFLSSAVLDSSDSSVKPDNIYDIRLTVTPLFSTESPVTVYGTVEINSSPSSGYCDFSPSVGEASMELFTISCAAWSDVHTPIVYSYSALKLNSTGAQEVILQTSSQQSYFSFTLGLGNWKLTAYITDRYGASTQITGEVQAIFSEANLAAAENDTVGFLADTLGNFATLGEDIGGDLSQLAALAMQVPVLTGFALSVSNDDAVMEVAQEAIHSVLSSVSAAVHAITPTVESAGAVSAMLYSMVQDPAQLRADSVSLASDTVTNIYSTLSTASSTQLVRKFPENAVTSVTETVQQLLLVSQTDDNRTEEFYRDLAETNKQTLRASLKDTLPGQSGYAHEGAVQSQAKRSTQGSMSEAGNSFTMFPAELTGVTPGTSNDILLSQDDIDVVALYGNASQARRRLLSRTGRSKTVKANVYDSEEDKDALAIQALQDCEPILITITTGDFNNSNSTVTANDTLDIPLCMSVEAGAEAFGWHGMGCSLVDWTDTTAVCSCSHLSSFSVAEDIYKPVIQIFPVSMFQNVNLDTVRENPFSVFAIGVFICVMIRLLPEVTFHASDQHLLAHSHMWSERRWVLVSRTAYFKTQQALFQNRFLNRMCKLTVTNFRNSHPVFGLCLRDACTNYTAHQRLVSIFVGIAAALCIEAIYYGITAELPVPQSYVHMAVSCFISLIPQQTEKLYVNHYPGFGKEAYEKIRERKKKANKCRGMCWCYLWSPSGGWICCKRKNETIGTSVSLFNISQPELDMQPELEVEGWEKTKEPIGEETPDSSWSEENFRHKGGITKSMKMSVGNLKKTLTNMSLDFKLATRQPEHWFEDVGLVESSAEGVNEVKNNKGNGSLDESENSEGMIRWNSMVSQRMMMRSMKSFTNTMRNVGQDFRQATKLREHSFEELDLHSFLGSGSDTYSETPEAVEEKKMSLEMGRCKTFDNPNTKGKSQGKTPTEISISEGDPSCIVKPTNATSLEKWCDSTTAQQDRRQVSEKESNNGRSDVLAPTISKRKLYGSLHKHTADVARKDDNMSVTSSVRSDSRTRDQANPSQRKRNSISKSHSMRLLTDSGTQKGSGKLDLPDYTGSATLDSPTYNLTGQTEGKGDMCPLPHQIEMLRVGEETKRGECAMDFGTLPTLTSVSNEIVSRLLVSLKDGANLPVEYQVSDRSEFLLASVSSDTIPEKKKIQWVNRKGASFLDKLQATLLKETTMNAKVAFFAWFLFFAWLATCCAFIIIFGINFDLQNELQPDEEIVDAGTSKCPSTQLGGTELHVDIGATDAMNLELSIAKALEENADFEQYPEDPVEVFPEDVPEASRFIIATFMSWVIGTFIFSVLQQPISGAVEALQTCRMRKRYKHLVSKNLLRANAIEIEEMDEEEKVYLLMFNPAVLVTMHETPVDEAAKEALEEQLKAERGYLAPCYAVGEKIMNHYSNIF